MFGNRRHFNELPAGSEDGIASNILASRLKQLVAGLLTRGEARRGQRAACERSAPRRLRGVAARRAIWTPSRSWWSPFRRGADVLRRRQGCSDSTPRVAVAALTVRGGGASRRPWVLGRRRIDRAVSRRAVRRQRGCQWPNTGDTSATRGCVQLVCRAVSPQPGNGDMSAAGIEHEPIETYDNGVRHISIPDPDGNLIAYAETPSAPR